MQSVASALITLSLTLNCPHIPCIRSCYHQRTATHPLQTVQAVYRQTGGLRQRSDTRLVFSAPLLHTSGYSQCNRSPLPIADFDSLSKLGRLCDCARWSSDGRILRTDSRMSLRNATSIEHKLLLLCKLPTLTSSSSAVSPCQCPFVIRRRNSWLRPRQTPLKLKNPEHPPPRKRTICRYLPIPCSIALHSLRPQRRRSPKISLHTAKTSLRRKTNADDFGKITRWHESC